MKIYHLSHTDLDGYSCQYIINQYFKNCVFLNSNYGKEINENFDLIKKQIQTNLIQNLTQNQKTMILISDLNLNLEQCEEFDHFAKEYDVKLLLLDHHQSGLECAKKYDWYFLDNSRCATKIVYDFFSNFFPKNEDLNLFVEVVNSIDIWLKDNQYFELGKVFLQMISSAKEINRVLFAKENTLYMFYLLNKASNFIKEKKANIKLEDSIHFLKKDFFKIDEDNTLNNLISNFIVDKLTKNKDKMSIFYNDHKGVLTSNIGNTSVIGNDFLEKNNDFDFFIDISSKKTLSFRSNGKIDVSLMAKTLVNGGGHKNASGGIFNNFKDSHNYDLIKEQIEQLIQSKDKK